MTQCAMQQQSRRETCLCSTHNSCRLKYIHCTRIIQSAGNSRSAAYKNSSNVCSYWPV